MLGPQCSYTPAIKYFGLYMSASFCRQKKKLVFFTTTKETCFRMVLFGFKINTLMDVIGIQPIHVDENRVYRFVWRAVPLPVLQARSGSGPTWSLRTAAQPSGGEHHRHVQTGLHQVRDDGLRGEGWWATRCTPTCRLSYQTTQPPDCSWLPEE